MRSLFWFRQDLRLADNPGLAAAAAEGPVLPVYILDDANAEEHKMGAASRVWLHHALDSLNASLNGKLIILSGRAEEILPELMAASDSASIHWNRCYEPWRMARDSKIKAALRDRGLKVQSHAGSLLWEPMEIAKPDGTPYKVFTPFYRRGCLTAQPPRRPLPAPQITLANAPPGWQSGRLDRLNLLPQIGWDGPMIGHWQVGEDGAAAALQKFISKGLVNYKDGRNFPGRPFVSRLSPHLHFGSLSPNQAWHAARDSSALANSFEDKNIDHFCSELGWREFSYHLLTHFPQLPTRPLQPRFDAFDWREDSAALQAWTSGQTGYPIIDAGMRELYSTGYMHNRVRMIVGSFLVKNLRLHWHLGEAWFWDTLVDADLANNAASWQWIAGCGADAAPYFRIFNPVMQGQKFDPDGVYTRYWVPELAEMPQQFLFSPWEAPELVLQEAGVRLDRTYPAPIVPMKASRDAALEAFAALPKAS